MLSGAAVASEPPAEAAPAAAGDIWVRIWNARALPPGWRGDWDRLAREAAEPNVFAERWFVEAGIRHLLPDGETWIVGVWRGGAAVGLLPVRIERRYGRTRVAHVQNWTHHQSFLGTPLIRRGGEALFWTELLKASDAA